MSLPPCRIPYYALKFLALTVTFKVYIVCQFENSSYGVLNNTKQYWYLLEKSLGDAVICVYFQKELLPFIFHGTDNGAISFTVSNIIHLKTYIWTE